MGGGEKRRERREDGGEERGGMGEGRGREHRLTMNVYGLHISEITS